MEHHPIAYNMTLQIADGETDSSVLSRVQSLVEELLKTKDTNTITFVIQVDNDKVAHETLESNLRAAGFSICDKLKKTIDAWDELEFTKKDPPPEDTTT